jgi:hypothetical protein
MRQRPGCRSMLRNAATKKVVVDVYGPATDSGKQEQEA